MLNTNDKLVRTAIALARAAMPRDGANPNELETAANKLADYCTKHKLSVADIIGAAAQPDTGRTKLDTEARAARRAQPKPEAKPAPEAPKPEAPKAEKPTKPADATKSADFDARVKLVNELRANVSALYNGPSLAVRGNPKRINVSVYADLFASPKHRTTTDRISARDVSFLALCINHGDKSAAFDPVALNVDSGIFSRMRSVGFIEQAPASSKLPYRLTKPAIEHVRLTTRAAA